mgnify:CR=1 FL=1
MQKTIIFQIKNIRPLTIDAIELSLVPINNQSIPVYSSGQFITLCITIDSINYKKSFSLCSSPFLDDNLKIGIKRIQGDKVSNYLHSNVKVGDTISMLKPSGKFTVHPLITNNKSHYFFAAGSGITPIYSMIKSILNIESNSTVYLLYGNRNQRSIIFKKEFDELKKQFPKNFILKYLLSNPEMEWSDLWISQKRKDYTKGRIESDTIKSFIDTNSQTNSNSAYYICGPEDMINSTIITLEGLDVPLSRIYFERFNSNPSSLTIIEGVASLLKAHLNHQNYTIEMAKGETILSALIKNHTNPPFSCESGTCGTCKCRLIDGKSSMKMNTYLSNEEVKEGYILACQSIPLSSKIEVRF